MRAPTARACLRFRLQTEEPNPNGQSLAKATAWSSSLAARLQTTSSGRS